jgi:hypothetical protein
LQKIHASETAWVGTDFDAILDNNHTIDNLYKQAALIISDEIALPPGDSLFAQNSSTVQAHSFEIVRSAVVKIFIYVEHSEHFCVRTFAPAFFTLSLWSISCSLPTRYVS